MEATSSSVVSQNHSFRQQQPPEVRCSEISRTDSAMQSILPQNPGRTGEELQSLLSRSASLDAAAPTVVHLQLCNWAAVLLTFVATVVRQNFNASAAANVQRIAHESTCFP